MRKCILLFADLCTSRGAYFIYKL